MTNIQAPLHWLQLVEHELLVFAAFWFIIGIIDEAAIDLAYLWFRLTGRIRTRRIEPGLTSAALGGNAAVLIPAWQEAEVIGTTISHTLAAWPQRELRLYLGCYRNDPRTIAAAIAAADGDPRLRLVIHDRDGPTTKADCLNRLYGALCDDEARGGSRFRSVVLHDAEDMVHPAGLAAIDRGLDGADFVQLPVRPEPNPGSRWIAGHYGDEFAEAHAKGMAVRDALGAALPAAGVGCGFARATLAELDALRRRQGGAGPFAAECLTEDYELGLIFSRSGRRGRFLRLRDGDGRLVATRSFFPADLAAAVRQKTRWVHGIAFQSWERLGWSRRPVEIWMALRDRRGPLTALVLVAAYALILVDALLGLAELAGVHNALPLAPLVRAMLLVSFAGFVWRAAMRMIFSAREYGVGEALPAVLRIPVSNVIAIMAARRALAAYLRSLRGDAVIWDKTAHRGHPASPFAREAAT